MDKLMQKEKNSYTCRNCGEVIVLSRLQLALNSKNDYSCPKCNKKDFTPCIHSYKGGFCVNCGKQKYTNMRNAVHMIFGI